MLKQLAGGVHHHHLDPGTQARIEAHGGFGAGGRGHQQAFQIAREHLDRFFLGHLTYTAEQLGFQVGVEFDLPGPAHYLAEPVVGGAAIVTPARHLGDHRFAGVRLGTFQFFGQHHGNVQHALVAATEQRQGTVAGNVLERFLVFKVIAELGAFLFLAVGQLRLHVGLFPQEGAQPGEQLGVLREALHQNLLGTVQGVLGGGDLVLFVQVAGGGLLRVLGGVVQQRVGERFQAGLAGDLRARAALGLVRQVEVFQAGFGVRLLDRFFQFRCQLFLLGDAFEDGFAPFLQLAQVAQPLFQRAQLGVIQAAGHFFTIPGDEGHRGAFVQQGHGGRDLPGLGVDFLGDQLFDALHGRVLACTAARAVWRRFITKRPES